MIPIAIIVEVVKDLAKYGPDAIAAGKLVVAAIRNGPHPLTAADVALLDSCDVTMDQILASVGGAPVTSPSTAP